MELVVCIGLRYYYTAVRSGPLAVSLWSNYIERVLFLTFALGFGPSDVARATWPGLGRRRAG